MSHTKTGRAGPKTGGVGPRMNPPFSESYNLISRADRNGHWSVLALGGLRGALCQLQVQPHCTK